MRGPTRRVPLMQPGWRPCPVCGDGIPATLPFCDNCLAAQGAARPLDHPDRHGEGCHCLMCQARRWLGYRPAEDRPDAWATLSIARYDGGIRGTGEPDRAYDSAAREADFELALASLPPFLNAVAVAFRSTPPALRGTRTDLVVRRVAASHPAAWTAERQVDGRQGKGSRWTLDRLVDSAAQQMAATMGERATGRPSRPTRARPIDPGPPEWAGAPANRR